MLSHRQHKHSYFDIPCCLTDTHYKLCHRVGLFFTENCRNLQIGGDLNLISDEMILQGLLTCPTVRAAAKSIGVSEECIYLRLRDDDFNERYTQAKLELLQDCVDTLQKNITVAIDVLRSVAEDDTAKEHTRVAASEAIIRNFCRLDEHTNILRRITNLENIMEEGKYER